MTWQERYDEVRIELGRLKSKSDQIINVFNMNFSKKNVHYLTNRFFRRSINVYSAKNRINELLDIIEPQILPFHAYIRILRDLINKSEMRHELNRGWLIEPFYVFSFYLHLNVIFERLLQYFTYEENQDDREIIDWFSTVIYGYLNPIVDEKGEQEAVIPHLLSIKENVNLSAYPTAKPNLDIFDVVGILKSDKPIKHDISEEEFEKIVQEHIKTQKETLTVIKVYPLPNRKLVLVFENAESRLYDTNKWERKGLFKEILDSDEIYYGVTVDEEGGNIVWPNGVNIDPLVLYLKSEIIK